MRKLILAVFLFLGLLLPWERAEYGKGPFISGWSLLSGLISSGGPISHVGPLIFMLIVGPILWACFYFSSSRKWGVLACLSGALNSAVLFFLVTQSYSRLSWGWRINGIFVIAVGFTISLLVESVSIVRQRAAAGARDPGQ